MAGLRIVRGSVVRSKAGRDSGFLVVTGVQEGYVLLADGKRRPLERPKRKNVRHIAATARILSEEEMATNRSIRRALREFSEPAGE